MLFKGYFINLDRSTDRRQDLENHLLEINLAGQYQRFAAVDGSRLAHVSQQFKPGEVGCYKSHLDLISSLDGSYHAHIMEDDARLSPKFASIVQSIPDDVIDRFDIIFIDTFVPFDLKLIQKLLLIQEELKKSGDTRIKLLDAKNFYFAGTRSYFVGSKSIAKMKNLLALGYNNGAIHAPIDLSIRSFIRQGKLKAAVAFPFLSGVKIYHTTTITDRAYDNDSITLHSLLINSFVCDIDINSILANSVQLEHKSNADQQVSIISGLTKYILSKKISLI